MGEHSGLRKLFQILVTPGRLVIPLSPSDGSSQLPGSVIRLVLSAFRSRGSG